MKCSLFSLLLVISCQMSYLLSTYPLQIDLLYRFPLISGANCEYVMEIDIRYCNIGQLSQLSPSIVIGTPFTFTVVFNKRRGLIPDPPGFSFSFEFWVSGAIWQDDKGLACDIITADWIGPVTKVMNRIS